MPVLPKSMSFTESQNNSAFVDPYPHSCSIRKDDQRGYKVTSRVCQEKGFPDYRQVPVEPYTGHLSKFVLCVAPMRRATLRIDFSDPSLKSKRLVFDNYDPEEFIKTRVYLNQEQRLVGIVENDVNIEKNLEIDSRFNTFRPVQALPLDDNQIYMTGTGEAGFYRAEPPQDIMWP